MYQVEVANNGKEEIDCMEELTLEHKRIWVQGLLMECPMGRSLEDCPAKALRSLSIDERLKLVFDMEEDQIEWIIAHHRECLRKREGKRPDPER